MADKLNPTDKDAAIHHIDENEPFIQTVYPKLQELRKNRLDKRLDSAAEQSPEGRFASVVQNVYTNMALESMRKISTVTFSTVSPGDEDSERGNWSNPIEFLLSCLGYVVGLGNIWRFPFLVYENGGGAFFIPYLLMLFLCGLPMVFMELTMGQYWSEGALTIWKVAPLFKGIGISMVIICFFCVVYYCMITGWALYYLAMSLTAHLPWSCCRLPWATEKCVSFVQDQPMCADSDWGNTSTTWTNISKFAADEFFHNAALKISSGLDDMGTIQWQLLVALAIAWIIVFLVLIRGVKSLGKFSYVTATLPYIVLTILLVRSLMQPGANDGIFYYLRPKWSVLLGAKVWGDAASQIFYSTGICFGGVVTLASYNTFRHNIYRDAIILAVGNSLTSFYSGLVVFSILGFMAHSQNTTIESVATSGPGLTFIAYPQAVTLLTASPVWSSLFFFMLSVLALSSMFPTTESIITAVNDQFKETLKQFKFWVAMAVCFVSFLLGLVLTTNGAMYVLQLFDTCAVARALLFVGLAEVMVIAWRYGAHRLIGNLHAMIGPSRTLVVWKYIWIFITPGLLLLTIIFSVFVQDTSLKYGSYKYPAWGNAVGWCLTAVSVAPIPLYALWKFVTYKRDRGANQTAWEALQYLTLPKELENSRLLKDAMQG